MDEPTASDHTVSLAAANYSSAAATTSMTSLCGAHFCPATSTEGDNPHLVKPDASRINTLSGIFLGCMVAACLLVAFGVDSLKR